MCVNQAAVYCNSTILFHFDNEILNLQKEFILSSRFQKHDSFSFYTLF